MSFKQKLETAHAELEAKKVWRSNYHPPMFSLLRVLGIKVPPPHYVGFHINALIAFAYLMPIMLAVLTFSASGNADGPTFKESFDKALLWGFVYAIFMACFYKIRTAKLQLTPWKDLK
ncbi:DUF6404 family protein [Marinomonas transparens]|uniref:Uncharacterized protein n=1 Tax=Marinomonas transparens TaxID=2795388 RepID=A0A934JSR3_9GAMM|nr:DUF6404 family protein [Marinomonas transparens]MBJ7539309.1 hypothetical protein [Marinomonas transparens]